MSQVSSSSDDESTAEMDEHEVLEALQAEGIAAFVRRDGDLCRLSDLARPPAAPADAAHASELAEPELSDEDDDDADAVAAEGPRAARRSSSSRSWSSFHERELGHNESDNDSEEQDDTDDDDDDDDEEEDDPAWSRVAWPLDEAFVPAGEVPASYRDGWDNGHVRLPCSPRNTYRRRNRPGRSFSRWYLIRAVFTSTSITTPAQLVDAIRSYQSGAASAYDLSGLSDALSRSLSRRQRRRFFQRLLPRIVRCALRLPELCPTPLPLLVPGVCAASSLNRLQVLSLLCNAFLCTFPKQQQQRRRLETAADNTGTATGTAAECLDDVGPFTLNEPFNMYPLFRGERHRGTIAPHQAAKLQCLFEYFERSLRRDDSLQRRITFERRVLTLPPEWHASERPIAACALQLETDGTIEDSGSAAVHVDFANRNIGGGVIGMGCVQEEIRFIIAPELMVSMLLVPQLLDNESVLITGAERFSNYTGYGKGFRFASPHHDTTPVCDHVLQTRVIVMDAENYGMTPESRLWQYSMPRIVRELNKAFCAFDLAASDKLPSTFATGNWGCGVFGGFLELKALLQLLAAAQAGKSLRYFTFGESELVDSLPSVYELCQSAGCTVGQVFRMLEDFSDLVLADLMYDEDAEQTSEEEDEEELTSDEQTLEMVEEAAVRVARTRPRLPFPPPLFAYLTERLLQM